LNQASTAALMLIFVFGGYDVVPVPAGEAIDPRRHVPLALIMGIVVVVTVVPLPQIVALSVLPVLAAHHSPIADSACAMVGAATLQLRRPEFQGRVKAATFTAPLGPLVPVVAILVSMAVVAGASRVQLLGGTVALATGAVLFLFTPRSGSATTRTM